MKTLLNRYKPCRERRGYAGWVGRSYLKTYVARSTKKPRRPIACGFQAKKTAFAEGKCVELCAKRVFVIGAIGIRSFRTKQRGIINWPLKIIVIGEHFCDLPSASFFIFFNVPRHFRFIASRFRKFLAQRNCSFVFTIKLYFKPRC